MAEPAEVVESIRRNRWTAVLVSGDGALAGVVAYASQPGPQDILTLAQQSAKGCAFRLVPQAEMTLEEVEQLIASLRGAQGYAAIHTLRPGVNIPGREAELARLDALAKLRRIGQACLQFMFRLAAVFR